MPATLDDLEAFARARAGARHDAFSSQALARAAAEFALRHRDRIAGFRIRVDGREFPSVFAALSDPGTAFETAELTLSDPPSDGRTWEWLRPFSRLVFEPDGAVLLHPMGSGDPERTIGRLLLREHYVPRPQEEATGGPSASVGGLTTQLDPLAAAVAFARKHGVVVFSAALLLYFGDGRVRYELDLVNDDLLKDPRAGRWPASRRVHRSSRLAHAVDSYIARGELPIPSARALEALVETHGTTPLEIAPVLGGVREYGASALQGLAARRLASFDRRTGVYRPRFDPFLGPERADRPAASPLPNPELRTSVMELLAAADARATCPLCGDALPPGPRRILCDRCKAEVDQGLA